MQRQEMLDGFQFQDHLVVDDEVGAVATVENDPVIINRQIDLLRLGDGIPVEFVAEATFVDAFEQAGAEARMHAHCQPDDPVGQAVGIGNVHALLRDAWARCRRDKGARFTVG